MPPRSGKKGAAASAQKRNAAAAAKSAQKAKTQPVVQEEPVKVEEAAPPVVETKEEEKLVPIVEKTSSLETPVAEGEKSEKKPENNGSVAAKEDEEMKCAFEEDDKGEKLDLEDEPEYEPEEDAGVEYDEKEVEHEEVEEEVDEVEEEAEEGDIVEEEEEGDFVDEEIEEGGEEEVEEVEVENGEGEEHDDIIEQDEHHEVVNERRKRKEFEVFVGGLDKDVSDDDLKKVFGAVGEVTEVRLMMNPQTKKNKGFAFLRFATVEQAKRAVSELKNPVINGKQCGVSASQDSDTLFLGNICKTWTKEALKDKLKHYGIEQYEDLTLVEDSNKEGMNRGFAFLEFANRVDAMEAFKRLQRRDVFFGVDRSAKVSFADSFIEPDDEIMAQVKTVFIDGLPASWDEDRVKECLKKYGVVEKIELARNMPSAKRKDFGFVTFDSHDAAVKCAESINNADLGEGDNKVKVRCRLSRPHQKGRGKHFGRGDRRAPRGVSRGGRASWNHAPPRRVPARVPRLSARGPPLSGRVVKRSVGLRDRRPYMAPPERVRPLPPVRSYDRRPAAPSYPRSSSKRDYGRRDELLPPRSSRAAVDYGSRVAGDRRSSYRDEYSSRGSAYSDSAPRTVSRAAARRPYADEGYGRRLERPPSYRESRARDYDSVSGSKRPYSVLDEDPRYADPRQSRARLDYGVGGSQYGDTYSDRLGRSHLGGYSSGRSSMSGQDSLYGSRHGMGYGGSLSSSEVGGMYSSSYGSDYLARGPDVGVAALAHIIKIRHQWRSCCGLCTIKAFGKC
ncbi:hypothetical protein H6P81_005421 [Aristolochia fimbriata]|uniref:RRM domain-containing protein n=1 Tax=Aristolochia fimbriata TaxID=158543 RepID=A0AAV7EXY3_ARIFI|nr:hypothetical protein H6P81_005421 [Aristolochia fimbriata]